MGIEKHLSFINKKKKRIGRLSGLAGARVDATQLIARDGNEGVYRRNPLETILHRSIEFPSGLACFYLPVRHSQLGQREHVEPTSLAPFKRHQLERPQTG